DSSGAPTSAGGISFDGNVLELRNTIVAANAVTGGGPPDVRGAVTTGSVGNLIGVGTAELSGITDGTDGNQIGTLVLPIDPLLSPLGDNGGPTLTRAPSPGSPAIDRGDSIGVPYNVVVDQRGFPRFAGPLLLVD